MKKLYIGKNATKVLFDRHVVMAEDLKCRINNITRPFCKAEEPIDFNSTLYNFMMRKPAATGSMENGSFIFGHVDQITPLFENHVSVGDIVYQMNGARICQYAVSDITTTESVTGKTVVFTIASGYGASIEVDKVFKTKDDLVVHLIKNMETIEEGELF